MDTLLGPTRRERLRAQTLAEIKEHALAQVAEGGPEAVSLSAIARAMRMSGPALYRYFGSREDLLVALVAESYDDLADSLQAAADAARRRAPAARFRAVTAAYRDWAVAHPHRYRLAFSSTYGSGLLAPEQVVPAAHRCMTIVLEAVAGLAAGAGSAPPRPGALAGQLEDWARDRPDTADLPAADLQMGVLALTRLHGVVSLEIGGLFEAMSIDPALLYEAEVDHLVSQLTTGARCPTTSVR